MAIDILYGFDTTDPQDQRWIERLAAYKRSRALGVPHDLVRRVKRTKVGREFVDPLARAMTPGQSYSAAQLAALLGPGWTPRRVASKFNSLGKPESRYGGVRIFERPADGQYALTEAMRNALLDTTL